MGVYINDRLASKIKDEKEIKDVVAEIGTELALEKIKSIAKDELLDTLGSELAALKLQIISGGN